MEKRKDNILIIRITEEEKAALKKAAGDSGMSEYVRKLLMEKGEKNEQRN